MEFIPWQEFWSKLRNVGLSCSSETYLTPSEVETALAKALAEAPTPQTAGVKLASCTLVCKDINTDDWVTIGIPAVHILKFAKEYIGPAKEISYDCAKQWIETKSQKALRFLISFLFVVRIIPEELLEEYNQ